MKCSGFCARALVLSYAISLCGCGGNDTIPLYSAGGKVTYKGQPVKNATVMFQPEKGPAATGTTDDNGKFTLSTGSRSGAVGGKYQVAITATEGGSLGNMTPEDYEKKGEAPQAEAKSLIPEKYGVFETSGLSVTVTEAADKNQFEFSLAD